MLRLSVLDLAPIVEGGSAGEALRNAAELAKAADRLGYTRYWMAEHHSMPGIASAATAVALAFVGANTSTIRIGAGGIMLPNHAPLVIAEQFGVSSALTSRRRPSWRSAPGRKVRRRLVAVFAREMPQFRLRKTRSACVAPTGKGGAYLNVKRAFSKTTLPWAAQVIWASRRAVLGFRSFA